MVPIMSGGTTERIPCPQYRDCRISGVSKNKENRLLLPSASEIRILFFNGGRKLRKKPVRAASHTTIVRGTTAERTLGPSVPIHASSTLAENLPLQFKYQNQVERNTPRRSA